MHNLTKLEKHMIHVSKDTLKQKPSKDKAGAVVGKTKVEFNQPGSVRTCTPKEVYDLTLSGHTIQPAVCYYDPATDGEKEGTGTRARYFKSQSLIVIDVDNDPRRYKSTDPDKPDGFETPSRTMSKLSIFGFKPAFMAYSFSHENPEQPKYHLFFFLDRPITDEKDRQRILQALIYFIPYSDPNCSNADRIIFGTNKGAVDEYTDFEAFIKLDHLFQFANIIEKLKKKQHPELEFIDSDTIDPSKLENPTGLDWRKHLINGEVPINHRNTILNNYVFKNIKHYGPSVIKEVYRGYQELVKLCNPPITETEKVKWWNHAATDGVKATQDPYWIPPKEFDLNKDKEYINRVFEALPDEDNLPSEDELLNQINGQIKTPQRETSGELKPEKADTKQTDQSQAPQTEQAEQSQAQQPESAENGDQIEIHEATDTSAAALQERKLNEQTSEPLSSKKDSLWAKVNSETETFYISTGFDSIDKVLEGEGLFPALFVLGAETGQGKTTLSLQIGDYVAEHGHDVIFFALEMTDKEIVGRSISRASYQRVNGDQKNKSLLFQAQDFKSMAQKKKKEKWSNKRQKLMRDLYDQYMEYTAPKMWFICGLGSTAAGNISISTSHIENIVANHIRRYTEGLTDPEEINSHHPLVIVDYLQILDRNPNMSDKENTDKAIRALKNISSTYNVPVLVISSFNRMSYKDQIDLAAFKESGSIEYTADVVMALQLAGMDLKENEKNRAFRINALKKEGSKRKKKGIPEWIELKILKNRSGYEETIPLDFVAKYNTFLKANPNERTENKK